MEFIRDIRVSFPQLGISYSRDDLRIDFNVQKKFSGDGNTAHISIYNLKSTIKSIIAKVNLEIRLEAGYVDNGSKLIFVGAIKKVEEFLSGADRVFDIFAIDGGQILERVGNFSFRVNQTITENVGSMLSTIQDQDLDAPLDPTVGLIAPQEASLRQELRGGTTVGYNPNNFPREFDLSSWSFPGKLRDGLNKYSLDRDYRSAFVWSVQDNTLNILKRGMELTLSPVAINDCTPIIGLPQRVDYANAKARFQERGDDVLIPLIVPDFFTWRITVLCDGDIKPYRTANINLIYPFDSIQGKYRIINVSHYGSNWDNDFYTEFEVVGFDLETQLESPL